MAEYPVMEGEVDFHVEGAGKPCKTWYKVFGALSSGKRPLVCLHGGPGVAHNYLLPIQSLASSEYGSTPVIMYDQLGCGRSTHLPHLKGATSFWTVSLFLDELSNLLAHLKITSYSLLGQSWGGMLGSEHAVLQPSGLHSLVIADSPASIALWIEAANGLREKLPKEVNEVLLRCEREGTTDSKEYEDAMEVFYSRHVCRTKPKLREMEESDAQLKADNTVYLTMNGPSEFYISGTLKTWSVIPKIPKINVPTLLINGKHDEATDSVMSPFFKSIEKVKWVKFAESSHCPQLEETEEFLKTVCEFLQY